MVSAKSVLSLSKETTARRAGWPRGDNRFLISFQQNNFGRNRQNDAAILTPRVIAICFF